MLESLGMVYGNDALAREQGLDAGSNGCSFISSTAVR